MRWSPLTPARCPLGTSSGRPVRDRSFSTTAFCYLLPEFGATTLLRTLDTRRIDADRERPLTEGELSRRTIQKILVQLYSILRRAKRKGWIAANPAEDAERVTVRRTGDFTTSPDIWGTRTWNPSVPDEWDGSEIWLTTAWARLDSNQDLTDYESAKSRHIWLARAKDEDSSFSQIRFESTVRELAWNTAAPEPATQPAPSRSSVRAALQGKRAARPPLLPFHEAVA